MLAREQGRSPHWVASMVVMALLLLVQISVHSGAAAGPPQQIHLSWQQKSTTTDMTVVWATDTESDDSQIRFGKTGRLELGYRAATTWGMPNEAGRWLHRVRLSGLGTHTLYYYRVGANSSGWSAVYSFTTGPSKSPPTRFTFTATADMGTTSTTEANIKRMVSVNPAFTTAAGDLPYADGVPAKWDGWFNLIQPLASGGAFMTALGNHEYESCCGASSYLGRFSLPRNERYYSFNYSNVHLIVLDSGSSYDAAIGATQTAWLEKDLKYNALDIYHPWTVVVLHFPPFDTGLSGNWTKGRQTWSPLFDRYGVELVIGGHDHNYQRTWPVWANATVAQKNYRSPRAPSYVITGGGGFSLHPLQKWSTPWEAFRAQAYETLAITVDGNTMSVRAVGPDGTQLDAFTITKG